ncbi:tripartite motif-containing protein 5-like [Convolutriloba macropyga]|uniref:tripartite motif-containing protein 5-like n=1 Tax=Convolutriloba macropyga TaxID=536237 RepID=UPI003F523C3B
MAASSLLDVECAICTDTLLDPRALPCGHSFCGPPRTCLNAIRCNSVKFSIRFGSSKHAKCAVCNQVFALDVDDLKPLYGIRDALQTLSAVSKSEDKMAVDKVTQRCQLHGNRTFLWCKDCSLELCSTCFEEKHEVHDVKSLKLVMKERAQELISQISETKKSTFAYLDSTINHCQDEIDNLTEQLRERNERKSHLNSQREILENFLKLESKLADYATGNNEFADCVRPYLGTDLSVNLKEIMAEFRPTTFSFTISKIREAKNGMKCSEWLKFEDLLLCVQAQYKLIESEPYMGIFLKVKDDSDDGDSSCEFESVFKFILTLENLDLSKNISEELQHTFSDSEDSWGLEKFISWSKLLSPKNGWLKDNCDISVQLSVFELY